MVTILHFLYLSLLASRKQGDIMGKGERYERTIYKDKYASWRRSDE